MRNSGVHFGKSTNFKLISSQRSRIHHLTTILVRTTIKSCKMSRCKRLQTRWKKTVLPKSRVNSKIRRSCATNDTTEHRSAGRPSIGASTRAVAGLTVRNQTSSRTSECTRVSNLSPAPSAVWLSPSQAPLIAIWGSSIPLMIRLASFDTEIVSSLFSPHQRTDG